MNKDNIWKLHLVQQRIMVVFKMSVWMWPRGWIWIYKVHMTPRNISIGIRHKLRRGLWTKIIFFLFYAVDGRGPGPNRQSYIFIRDNTEFAWIFNVFQYIWCDFAKWRISNLPNPSFKTFLWQFRRIWAWVKQQRIIREFCFQNVVSINTLVIIYKNVVIYWYQTTVKSCSAKL